MMSEMERQEAIDREWMQQALDLAAQAASLGEVPVAAVIVKEKECIATAYNRPILSNDPTAHAEIAAIREAGQVLGNYRLNGCTLYVTIEPCAMCVGALIHARINRLVFGAKEPRAGAVVSRLNLLDQDCFNHSVKWHGGVLGESCSSLLKDFFKQRR